MRQIRSADPWSTFLASGRAANTVDDLWRDARPAPAGPSRPTAGAAGPDPSDARRRVLECLRSAHGARTLEELRLETGLSPLEVAEAVAELRERGLVAVEREVDEVVRLTEPRPAG